MSTATEREPEPVPLATDIYSLYRGHPQPKFICHLKLISKNQRHQLLDEVWSAYETSGEGVRQMVMRFMLKIDDFIHDVWEKVDPNWVYTVVGAKNVMDEEKENTENLQNFFHTTSRTGVVVHKDYTTYIFAKEDIDVLKLEDIKEDGDVPFYVILVDNATTGGLLEMPKDFDLVDIRLPDLSIETMRREYRKAFFISMYEMPPNLPSLVEGKKVYMFAPDIFSVKEVKWLLETCGATLVEDDDTSEVDIVMAHRWYQDQITYIPGLTAMKSRPVRFVLFGHTFATGIGAPGTLVFFPGGGGLLTLATDAVMRPDAADWLRKIDEHNERLPSSILRWGIYLHPNVHQVVKSFATTDYGDMLRSTERRGQMEELWVRISQLKDNETLKVAGPGEVYPAPPESGVDLVQHMMVRLQYSWHLNFRHFIIITYSAGQPPRQKIEDVAGGIREMTFEQFAEEFM